jgi:hypothetical protein
MSEGSITHVAGGTLSYSRADQKIVRQRCAWCGALLMEVMQSPFPFPPGTEPEVDTFTPYSLVRVDGSYSENIDLPILENGDAVLPDDSCMRIDTAVTT